VHAQRQEHFDPRRAHRGVGDADAMMAEFKRKIAEKNQQ
jgi:hypothetical protein